MPNSTAPMTPEQIQTIIKQADVFMALHRQVEEQAKSGVIADPALPTERLLAAIKLLELSPYGGEPGKLSVKQLLAEAPNIHLPAITVKTREKRANPATFLTEHDAALGVAAEGVRTARETALSILVPVGKAALALAGTAAMA